MHTKIRLDVPKSHYLPKVCKNPYVIGAVNTFLQRVSLSQNMKYSTVPKGELYSGNYKLYFKNESGFISPHHDIPLFSDKASNIFNMVVEIPRWTNAKYEIATKEFLNPIHQDMKKGQPRFVDNVFPHHGYIWNYGALPQTWEDPSYIDPNTSAKGDNDPIDICEIGYRIAKSGDVIQVKVLGIMALIDEGETDWKILAIDINDPLADELNDIQDIEKHMPGYVNNTIDWFKYYKIPAGKDINKFAFEGQPKDRAFAHKIIHQTHEHWRKLLENETKVGGLDCKNTTNPVGSHKVESKDAEEFVAIQPPFKTASRAELYPKGYFDLDFKLVEIIF